MTDCIFCKIINGEIPATKVYEDDDIVAFHDISKQAPVHILILPRTHVSSVTEVAKLPDAVAAKLWRVAAQLAAEQGISGTGFRLITNSGTDACQSVPHWHIHLLGGAQLTDKMG